jgi:cell division protein FtsL
MISELIKNELVNVFSGRILMLTFLITVVCAGGIVQAAHWLLRISAHGKYLEDQDGVPFPIIGDAC